MKSEEAVIPSSAADCSGQLEDIDQLVSHSGNPTETLTNIVNLALQQRFATDVYSIICSNRTAPPWSLPPLSDCGRKVSAVCGCR